MKSKRGHRLEAMLHFMTAFVLYLKGVGKVMHHHDISGYTIIFLATVVLVIAFAGKRMGLSHGSAKLICYFIESVALFITGYVYLGDGKTYIPYLYMFAGGMYLVAAAVHLLRPKPSH